MSNHAASRKHYYTVLLDRTLVCFLLVVVLNFFLPRLLPGNPVAYLTGFSEQDMTPAQVAFYEDALHLNKPLAMQFGYYLRSLLDGTLGWAEGLEPGADSGEESCAPGDGEATEGSDPHDNE